MAGRVLRPLRAMATTTQRITERNLHERLALPGPSDEVKDLADTIDDLLGRLETAFLAQRHFVANASHELRTPLTLDRTLIDVALADPHADAEDLRETLKELLVSGEQQERLIDALLTLASSERGLDRQETIDLAGMAERVVAMHRPDIDAKGLATDTTFGQARISGNGELVERLIDNLVDNAIGHNVAGGYVDVTTGMDDGHAVVIVANSGPTVPQEAVDRLFQPFQRLHDERSSHPDGHGLGLSIVRAIAASHGAGLKVQLRPEGGLRVEVHFLPPSTASGPSRAHQAQHERMPRSPMVKEPVRNDRSP
jgi:signal transduction histidine kinase